MTQLKLHPDRLFPAEQRTRDIARALHAGISNLPIISPHGAAAALSTFASEGDGM